jgi:DNA-binding CsgD family transcriptional regulator
MKTRGRPRHPDVLTPREWEALTLVREGLTNPQIAERMGISMDTAKSHVSEIISKLQVNSREEAAAWQPEPAREAVLRPSWASALGGLWSLIPRVAGAGAMAAAVAGIGVLAYAVMRTEGDDTPLEAAATEQTAAPPDEEVTELLNAFLAARIAGEGAEQYLNSLSPEISPEDVPLLYETSTGAPYERGEFEPVPGIEWPYGFKGFKVRMFTGDTLVEQLFFMPYDAPGYFPANGRPGLEYQPDGFATDIAPTTEDGQPVARPYSALNGQVTVHIAHPWIGFGGTQSPVLLIPEGVGPTTDGGQRYGWDHLQLVADPEQHGTDCEMGAAPSDAEALAASIQSDPDLETTIPAAVVDAEAKALMMDVAVVARENNCIHGVPSPPSGSRMRLYLFDAPEGSSMRILAIAIVVPESRFERAVEGAAPVVEFHAR